MTEVRIDGGLARAAHHSQRAHASYGVDLWAVANRAIALAIVIFLLPLMVAIAMAIWVQDRGPIFFAHRRIGRGGRAFHCLKFRTMKVDAEARLERLLATDPRARLEWEQDHKLRIDPRVTRLGEFLRRSSLDELAQLFNVLRGEMNLVGPRPIVEAEAHRYGPRLHHYQAVKPGITGLWQVSGRNDVTYRRRIAMDCLYAARRTPALDVLILVRTIPAVILRRGAY